MSADAGWGARHASRAAPLGRKYIEGSASQVRLHHYQARNGLLPICSPGPILTEAVL